MQVGHLAQDALHIARPLAATGVGHYAVVAEVVAAAHDADEAADVGQANALRHDVTVSLRLAEGNVDGVVASLALGYHVGQVEVAVGPADQVGVVVVYQVVLDTLGHAAQHAQDELAAPFLLGMQGLQPVIYLVLGVLAYAAGVQEYRVGAGLVLAQFIACHLHDGGYHL